MESLEKRIEALERRVAALEEQPPTGSLWLVDGLASQGDIPGGSVAFGGTVDGLVYQWHRPADTLKDEAWDTSFERLEALAHPARGVILRYLLDTPATVVDLVEAGIVSSAGSGYHHLGALAAGGWVTKSAGGQYHVRDSRVIPLFTIIAAAEDH